MTTLRSLLITGAMMRFDFIARSKNRIEFLAFCFCQTFLATGCSPCVINCMVQHGCSLVRVFLSELQQHFSSCLLKSALYINLQSSVFASRFDFDSLSGHQPDTALVVESNAALSSTAFSCLNQLLFSVKLFSDIYIDAALSRLFVSYRRDHACFPQKHNAQHKVEFFASRDFAGKRSSILQPAAAAAKS
jgi:hypothetical protein